MFSLHQEGSLDLPRLLVRDWMQSFSDKVNSWGYNALLRLWGGGLIKHDRGPVCFGVDGAALPLNPDLIMILVKSVRFSTFLYLAYFTGGIWLFLSLNRRTDFFFSLIVSRNNIINPSTISNLFPSSVTQSFSRPSKSVSPIAHPCTSHIHSQWSQSHSLYVHIV